MCLLCGWCVCVCLGRSQRAAVMYLQCGDRGEGVGGRGRKEEIAFVTATHSAPGCLLLLFHLHRGCRWLDVCVVAAIGVHVAYNRTRSSMQHAACHLASLPSAASRLLFVCCYVPRLFCFHPPPLLRGRLLHAACRVARAPPRMLKAALCVLCLYFHLKK